MPVTEDPGIDPAITRLFRAMNDAADGHSPYVVLEAAANFFITALSQPAMAGARSRGETLNKARQFSKKLVGLVADQLDRAGVQ